MPASRRVLFALPDPGFNPTEVAVPWSILLNAGHDVVFATESRGETPRPDVLTLEGPLPRNLLISPEAKERFAELETSPAFQAPIRWADINPDDCDALVLPGGHGPGVRSYLESEVLREKIRAFWSAGRLVGAIDYGVLALARTKGAKGKSVLHDRRTTSVPRMMELAAYAMTFMRHGRHYRLYDDYLEDEVTGLLDDPSQFDRGPVLHASVARPEQGFALEDGHYVSARYPGDAWAFGRKLEAKLARSSER